MGKKKKGKLVAQVETGGMKNIRFLTSVPLPINEKLGNNGRNATKNKKLFFE